MSVSFGMGGSSGSTSIGGRSFTRSAGRRCKCGRQSTVYTSKTERNLNRAFFVCPYFKENKPYCNFFRWVDDGCNERMELEEERINKAELDVAEMDFKLKYVDMKLSDHLEVKLSKQELKINEQERKIKELSLKMVSELDRMEKENRHVGRLAKVAAATIAIVVMICIFVGSRLSMKKNVPNLFLLK